MFLFVERTRRGTGRKSSGSMPGGSFKGRTSSGESKGESLPDSGL